MIKWIFILLAIAVVAALLGFGGVAHLAAGGAEFLVILLVIGVVLVAAVGVGLFRRMN